MKTLLWIGIGIGSCGVLIFIWSLLMVAGLADEEMFTERQRRGSGL